MAIGIGMLPVYIIVTPFFPSPTSWRGAYCFDFANSLRKTRQFDVRVFVPGNGPDYEVGGLHVSRFPVKLLPSNFLPFLFARSNRNSFLAALKRSRIKVDDIAVCHGHTANFAIYPIAVKEFNPTCLTLLHHHSPASFGLDNGLFRHVWFYNLFQFILLRRLHEKIDCHVFISRLVERSFRAVPNTSWTNYKDYKRQMRGLFWLRSVQLKNSICLYNGVDRSLFAGGREREGSACFTIGCVANFIDWKDQLTLLKAIDVLCCEENANLRSRLKVVFVGSGPMLLSCKKYAAGHNVNAEFRKEVAHEKLPDFYRGLDLFVLPSFFEGFGCVFTEAYSAGVPFMTTTAAGVVELIQENDRENWVFPPGDFMTLAEKIRNFMSNRRLMKLSGAYAFDDLLPPYLQEISRIRSEMKGRGL